jgi:hypothetical protein
MMKMLRIAGLVTLALVGVLQASARATDRDTFAKFIAKLAPDEASLKQNFKPKLGCDCLEFLAPGIVMLSNKSVVCGLPFWNADGSFATFTPCDGDFIVLH